MGWSSGSSSQNLTPEQTKQNQLINTMLESYIPTLQNTLSTAQGTYNNVNANVANASNNAIDQSKLLQGGANAAAANALGASNNWQNFGSNLTSSGSAGAGNVAGNLSQTGASNAAFGSTALQGLFSPDYEAKQVRASLQPAIEQTREAMGGQNAQYGAAGALGSSRNALANANLSSLAQNRMQSTAAQTQAAIEAQRQSAASTLFNTGVGSQAQAGSLYGGLANTGVGVGGVANAFANTGNTLGNTALNASTTGINAANAPLSSFSQLANIIFGVPGNTTSANFTGTQGTSSSGIKI